MGRGREWGRVGSKGNSTDPAAATKGDKVSAGLPRTWTLDLSEHSPARGGGASPQMLNRQAVGIIIGPGGSTIRELQAKHNVELSMPARSSDNPPTVSGPLDNVLACLRELSGLLPFEVGVISEERREFELECVALGVSVNDARRIWWEITLPKEKIGLVIGKGGETVRRLQDAHGVQLSLPTRDVDEPSTVTGPARSVRACLEAISELTRSDINVVRAQHAHFQQLCTASLPPPYSTQAPVESGVALHPWQTQQLSQLQTEKRSLHIGLPKTVGTVSHTAAVKLGGTAADALVQQFSVEDRLVSAGNDAMRHLESLSHRNLSPLAHWDKLPRPGVPFLFHGVNGVERYHEATRSWSNENEIDVVVAYIHQLLTTIPPLAKPGEIGVMAPYKHQVQRVRSSLAEKLDWKTVDKVLVGPSSAFTGLEKRVLLITSTRVYRIRMSVEFRTALGMQALFALMRATELLVVVGQPAMLLGCPNWSDLLERFVEVGATCGVNVPTRSMVRELGLQEDVFGPNHPKVATVMDSFTATHTEVGRYTDARGLQESPDPTVDSQKMNELQTMGSVPLAKIEQAESTVRETSDHISILNLLCQVCFSGYSSP